MAQRVRIPHRGQGPSSVTQLPILTALHARFPTLFLCIIHQKREKVNSFYRFFTDFLSPFAFCSHILLIMMKKLPKVREKLLLFVRYCFIINSSP